MTLLLFFAGFATGVLGGALGVGGGIVLAPVLLYLPPGIGLQFLEMRAVAALTIVQSFSSCFAGTFVHRKLKCVHVRLAALMGTTVAVVSFVAALASSDVPQGALQMCFAGVAVLAAGVMAIPKPGADRDVDIENIEVRVLPAVSIAAGVGVLGGLVGQGGAFLVVPAMLYILGIPTRVTIGTSLAVAFCAATAGLAGKALSGQVELGMALALGAGALLGSSMGALLSRRIPAKRLRVTLACVLWATAARMVWSVV